MNKKLFGILSAFLLSVTLFSCGKKDNSNSPSTNVPSTNTSTGTSAGTSTNPGNSSSVGPVEPDVKIPEGMVAVNFRYNYGDNLRFKIVPYFPGDKIEKPSLFDQPQRSGYMFKGWYADRYCMNSFDFANSTVPENGLDIYAGWNVFDADPLGDQAIEDSYKDKTYTITYTSGPGFSYINPNGALIKSADAEDVIEFKLAIGRDYEGEPVVTANSETLTASQGLYSYTITGNTTFAVSGLSKKENDNDNQGNLVSWYLVGEGSLWGSSWTKDDAVQLIANPANENDKGMLLGIKFEVGDTFKVTDGGQTWFGWEGVNKDSQVAISNFRGVDDSFGGQNIQCTVADTYNIYVNEWGQFWIELA